MKKFLLALMLFTTTYSYTSVAQAPISDSSLLANFIQQVGKDTKETRTSVSKLQNSTTTLVSLGTIGSMDDFADPLSSLGTNALSTDVVSSIDGSGSGSGSTTSGAGAASGAASSASKDENSTQFPSSDKVRTGVANNLQLPDNDEKLTSSKVSDVRRQFPKTKAAIATYGVSTAWVNRTIATRNIKEAKEATQKKADETQDNRKAITSKTSSVTNVAETYNRLLMSAAAANALSAINTMEKAGNLH